MLFRRSTDPGPVEEIINPTPTVPPFDHALAAATAALDLVATGVLIADEDLTLRWMNHKATEVLNSIDGDLQKVFGIGAHQLLDGSIHRFHRDPDKVERVLRQQDGFALPHSAEFSFGSVTLRTNINRFVDTDGAEVGYLVSFEDVSELRIQEARAQSLVDQLDEAGTAIEQLNESIAEISANASQAAELAGNAERETSRISGDASDLDSRRAEIDAAIESIDEVAELTQLLALNATIEAARAGETGKGFAVVASEVKNLAVQTAEVTAEIEAKLKANGDAIGQLRADLETVGEQMSKIDNYQTSIAGAVEEQQATASVLADNIRRAARSV
jgi:methyl-accepting chemotaxis protein